jgi:hypothetical protein
LKNCYKALINNILPTQWGGVNDAFFNAVLSSESTISHQFNTKTMTDFKKNLKALALLLGLALAMPFSAQAQTTKSMYHEGSLMDDDPLTDWYKQSSLNNRGAVSGWTLSNQQFGNDAPLGSGIILLIGAGLGYAALKRRKEEQQ